ncbi:adenylate/guanylate cyclase catalytic domain protein [Leptospira broomii serovar Hurstbridge str. 5399]|uniref:Adenylate/guanylate cyclase catalytic domain protein n=1 Tax=Leptospira broomii serovar Hurstbridge str. 5399 TaxID=1049789 RepID=T0G8N0_9LEPT|nr:adenylate/guanylate cyclase catalytic domain protein [Leptospira broomii serovar Hurstbridge str. 5399]
MKFGLFFGICSVLFFSVSSCSRTVSAKISPVAEKGVLDLREWNFPEDGIVKLDGEWKFLWKELPLSRPKSDAKEGEPKIVSVPGNWNQIPNLVGMNSLQAYGYGTYSLKVLLGPNSPRLMLRFQDAGTAASVFIDGKKIVRNGVVGVDSNSSRPQYLPQYAYLSLPKQEFTIRVEVSNFHHFKGGLWESIRVGTESDMQTFRENRSSNEMILFGSIIIMAFYHFGLFSLRRRDLSGLFFGCFCLAISLRLVVTGERFLIRKFPDLPWELWNKAEYLSIYLAVPFFVSYMDALFPGVFSSKARKASFWFHALLAITVVLTPARIYSHTMIPFELLMLIHIAWIIFVLSRLLYRGSEGALTALGGMLALTISSVNDILYSQALINTGYYLPFGLFAFIFAQSYLLSFRFSQAFLYIERLSDNLLEVNRAYSRFVPLEFLKFLNKENITEIGLGNQVQREMTILFSDIRDFTHLSEKMSPKDNFDFLNSYMRRMGPVIRKNKGFVDKYLGDGIMALFPNSPDDALQAAMEMLKELENLNLSRKERKYEPIRIGIGLHTGTLMLGTIGEEERMDGTVISDAVNLASRIEGLTKELHATLLLSEDTYKKLHNRKKYSFNKLGKVIVKGKSKSSQVYEVVN